MGNATSKHRMKLEYENRKLEAELRSRELRRNYELQIKKAEMEHQQKIVELMTQMKETKSQAGKELILIYVDAIKSIIRQSDSAFQNAIPFLHQLSNDKLSDSIKKATESAIIKIYEGYMTKDLLEYSRKQIQELQLRQDDEFVRLLDFAVERKILLEKDKIHLLEDIE